MVAWPAVCRPTDMGGLGIPDLHLIGIALQCRWLWLRHTDETRVWADLPLAASREVQKFFDISTYTVIGNGRSTAFWTGRWVNGQAIKDIAPSLITFVRNRDLTSSKVADALPNRAWVRQIVGGITVAAMREYLHVWDLVSQVHLTNEDDRLVWRWANDGAYSSKSAYRALHMTSQPIHGCSRIWETWAPLRVKIFLWLAIRRRHWTADRRRRHGLETDDNCYLCDQQPESMDHILTSCPYSRQVWWNILTVLGVNAAQIGGGSMIDWWDRWRQRWHGDKRRGADSLFAIVTWEIWKERNARCFRNAETTVLGLLQTIKRTADDWIEAGARKLSCLLRE